MPLYTRSTFWIITPSIETKQSWSTVSELHPLGSLPGRDENATASIVPGGAWLVSVAVVEGAEMGSVASHWASSEARSAGRERSGRRAGAEGYPMCWNDVVLKVRIRK